MSTLIGLFCLLIIKNTQVVSQSLCGANNYLEVKEGQNNTFTCTGLTAQQTVFWFYESTLVSTCNVSGCKQDVHRTRFSSNRPDATYSNFIVYVAAFSDLDYLSTTNLSCQTSDSKATCQVDVIYPAENPKCEIEFSGYTWQLTGWCNVSKVRSRRGRYFCYLYQTSDQPPKTSVGNFPMSTTPINGTNYSSGECQFKRFLPPEGTYNYSVIIIPGEVEVFPSFNGSNKIRRPSQSPQHNCPQNVTEGDNIDCLCYSENLGAPSGSLIWQGTNSSRLKIDNVNRTYSGRSHFCYLMWNNSVVQNVTYEVTVNYASRVLSFSIDNKTDTMVNVSENTNVSVVCQAEGRPLPTMRIFKRSGDNQTLIVTNDTLQLQHTMSAVMCETTGNYTCESENSVSVDHKYIILIASCSPKNVTSESYSTRFEVDKATLTFQMFANPMPDLLAIFYMGPANNSTSKKIEHENTTRSTCSSENLYGSMVSCHVTLYEETVYATGFYLATFANLLGNISFDFEIKEKIFSTAKATSTTDSDSPVTQAVVGGFIGGVVGGVVGGIVLIILSVVIIIFIVRRRRKSIKQPSLRNTCMEENLSQEQNIEADTAHAMYSVVNKKKKGSKSTEELTPTDAYATVVKKGAEHASSKKPNKRKKKEKAVALPRSSVTESEYQSFDENEEGKETKGAKESRRRNQQGLLYTIVVFDNTLSTSLPKSESSEIVYSEIVSR